MAAYLLWLCAGVVCLLLEAMGVNGVGFLFAGLGALTTGSVVTAMPELAPLQQGVFFFSSTGLWAGFLWIPLKKFRGKLGRKTYSNIIGDTAFIGASGLQRGMIGEATWSGTIMRAELAEGVELLLPGAQAIVVEVAGNTLIVKPKI